jgi:hypothetical protein
MTQQRSGLTLHVIANTERDDATSRKLKELGYRE